MVIFHEAYSLFFKNDYKRRGKKKQKEKDWKINLENQNTEEEWTEGRERKEGENRSWIWLVTASPICNYALDTQPHLSSSRDNLYQFSEKKITSEAGFTHISRATFRGLYTAVRRWFVAWLLTSLIPQNSINIYLDFKLILLFDRYCFSNSWYIITCLHKYYTNPVAE